MFLDARKLDTKTLDFDICIVGAGAAGITLARALDNSGRRICLLESGGLELEPETQSLYKGDIVGLPYFLLDVARLRYFGGTTGHWGGACWPLGEIEFTRRDWVPYSGWPITRKDLDPYYVKAQETVEIGPFNYSPEYWSKLGQRPLLPMESRKVVTRVLQNSSPPTRFGTRYREEIEASSTVTTLLHANVTRISLDDLNRKVDAVTIQTLEGKQAVIRASIFVIAAGGLENPRLLLLNDIGNQNDLVGRFFMEHVRLPASTLLIPKRINTSFYQRAPINGTEIRAGLSLANEALEEERILNAWSGFSLKRTPEVRLQYNWDIIRSALTKGELPDNFSLHVKNIYRSLRQMSAELLQGGSDDEIITIPIANHSEQAPNPDSRVTLGDELDPLGQRKIRFDWRLTDLDRRTVRRTQEIIAAEIGRNSLGRMRVLAPEEADVWDGPERASETELPTGSFHHIGTTRMHHDPKQGVVDKNCLVHGTRNLYIAGSSVFTTSGFENPTLTIVALAYRLADHLGSRLA